MKQRMKEEGGWRNAAFIPHPSAFRTVVAGDLPEVDITDESSVPKALKRYGKVVRMLDSARKRGGDPGEVAAAQDAILGVLRRIAQRAVASVSCGSDDRCIEGMTRLQEKIWKGDAKRARGRKASAVGSYVKAYKGASKH